MTRELAPIVLFVYNRLNHTKQTIEALKQNKLAGDSVLYIFSDGAKNENNKNDVENVRDYIDKIGGFEKIVIVKREKNWGLADSIVNGVTEVVNRHGKVIVLEEDIVTSQYFLQFMNDSLDFYEKFDKVMAISGYQFPISIVDLSDSFFLRMPESWGWATWKNSWSGLDRDAVYVIDKFSKKQIYEFNLDGTTKFFDQLKYNINAKEKTWAIFWYAHVFLQNGLSLYPKQSLARNIGWDGSGQFCGIGKSYEVDFSSSPISNFPEDINEDENALQRVKMFFKKQQYNMRIAKWKGYLFRSKKLFKK